MIVLVLLQEQQTLTPGSSIVDQLKGNWVVLHVRPVYHHLSQITQY